MGPVFLAASEAAPAGWMILPFALLLFLIAAGPLLFSRFWDRFHGLVAVGLGVCTACFYGFGLQRLTPLVHAAAEYFSFLSLVGSLYVVSGGIVLRSRGEATPLTNSLFLLAGALLANVLGTTGASMLLVRPWIRMNKYRITGFHVVFFILLVSNIGGCLTPIGDPPLFLGFLKGVPFWWPLQQCWQPWLFTVGALLLVFMWLDRRNFLRAPAPVREAQTRVDHRRIEGLRNLPLLAVTLCSLLLPFGWREAVMLVAAGISWRWTPRHIHASNHFDFAPIKEVAWLFAGIFLTMLPALEILGAQSETFGLKTPLQFFFWTGALSGLLDNAPTYLAFLSAAFGTTGLHLPADMPAFLSRHGPMLRAISVGSVFFGAMTYIGNGPNLMVKKIAEQQRVATPSFLEYIALFSLPLLLPLFGLVGFLCFSTWRVF
jgi:Na+/H+ antiporter NhaD/arsenite permease-like protein